MLSDLKVAFRSIRARPLFSFIAVMTLGLGLGANAAIFSVINAVLLRPLPFPASERIVSVHTRYLPSSGYDFPYFSLSGPEFTDLQRRVDAFARMGAYGFGFRNLTHSGGDAERILTLQVTAGFLDVLGVSPARGRTFTEDEAQQRGTCVAILADEMSRTTGSDVGSVIRLDDAPCEVIGVMPEGFGFRDDRVRVWTTLSIDTDESDRESHPLLAIARLREGVTPEQAEAQLESLRAYWSEKYPGHYANGHFAVIRPLQEDLVGDQRQMLRLLGGAVAFVLLIVSINLAALLVSRTEARRREFAVRRALGASRLRLIRQLLGETMLLAAMGGIVGVLLANWLLAGLLALYPQRLPVWQTISVDHAAMLFTFGLLVIAGFAVAVVPALHVTGTRLHETLKADTRAATATRGGVIARSALVISQIALSVVVLVGAILLIRSYQHLQRIELGFEPDGVLTFSVSVPQARQPEASAARRTLAAIEERLAAMPGAEMAGAISNLPLLSAGPPDDFVIDGRPAPAAGTPAWNARYLMVTPRIFRTLRIPLMRGRLLAETDTAGRPLVAVINEAAAQTYWPGEDPVGRTIRYYPRETSPSIRIVGIVGDVRSMGATAPAPPAVYVPFEQAPRPPYEGRTMTFVVRVHGNPTDVIASARAAVASVDVGLPLANVQPMSAVVTAAANQPRFTTLIMSFFAGVAFFLAGLGLYGILAYGVEQRFREIGIRVALGADRREIVRLIVGTGMRLALLGLCLGVPAALVLMRVMGGLLSGISSTDPATYLAVAAMLAACALLASYVPALRATRIDPIAALRTE